MSPEERRLLEETFKLTKENSKSLKKINRRMTLGAILRIFYWVLIIGAGVGLFYFLQPQIDNVKNTFGSFSSRVETVNSLINEGS